MLQADSNKLATPTSNGIDLIMLLFFLVEGVFIFGTN
jgi:hypothetical protein